MPVYQEISYKVNIFYSLSSLKRLEYFYSTQKVIVTEQTFSACICLVNQDKCYEITLNKNKKRVSLHCFRKPHKQNLIKFIFPSRPLSLRFILSYHVILSKHELPYLLQNGFLIFIFQNLGSKLIPKSMFLVLFKSESTLFLYLRVTRSILFLYNFRTLCIVEHYYTEYLLGITYLFQAVPRIGVLPGWRTVLSI